MTTPSTRTGVVIPHHGPGKVDPLVDVRREANPHLARPVPDWNHDGMRRAGPAGT